MEREQAIKLLKQYNKEAFHLQHAFTVEKVMGWYADKLGYGGEKAHWEMVGLLHDLDFEEHPDKHCEVSMSPRLDTQSRSGWTVAAEKMDSRGVSVGH